MRKWMRERLQRRKKTPVEPSDQPAAPPLQPAYFDAEQQPSTAPDAGNIESKASAPPPPVPEPRPVRRARSNPQEQQSQGQPSQAQPATPNPAQSCSGRSSRAPRGC